MKKSLSRILSVALVLAMLISVVPFALAVDSGPAKVTITAPESVKPGETLTVTANVSGLPYDAKNIAYAWFGDAVGSGNTATYLVPADTAETEVSGGVVVTYTYQEEVPLEEGDEGYVEGGTGTKLVDKNGETSDVYQVSIKDEVVLVTKITVTSENNENTVEIDKTLQLAAVVEPEDAANQEVTWASSDISVATVSENGLVTGVKAGNAVITAAAKDGSGVFGAFPIVVTTGPVVSCEGISIAVKGSKVLEPKVTDLPDGQTILSAAYEYTTTDKNITVGKTTGIVTGTSTGVATVHIKATYTCWDGTSTIAATAEGDVHVSVYSQPTLEVTLKDGTTSFEFGDTKVFSEVKYNDVKYTNWVDESMYSLLSMDGWNSISFLESSAITSANRVGSLSVSKSSVTSLPFVKFTSTRSGSYNVAYTIYDEEGLILAIGDLTIQVGGSAGDIVYETDYNTDITFDEDDFEDFWNSVYTASTNTLRYVEFGVASNVPAYGELYTTTSKTKPVTSAMKFQPNYSTSSTYYDLDTVTYEPSSRYTTAYTVEIPFTAYGGTSTANLTSLSGTVVIELNGTSTNITSRGVVFGTGTKSIADMMVEDYAEAMKAEKAELAYVTFVLPDVEDGRLYYDYDGILDSTRVSSKESYYVDATSKQLDLEKVAFIPAAGTTGKVIIKYVGYDEKGNNPYEGKVVLNVTAKTKSDKFTDVTTTSYSWAADSIDFLYYEEVVNGTSSTKFGPAASITRGDFMIMLYRAFLEEDYGDYNVTSNFADVPKGTSAYEKETYQAVGVAKYLGIAKGDGTNFNPKSSITREEAMTLIYRTLDEVDLDLEYTSTKTTASFSDYSKVSTYAQTSITYLIKHGIVIGSNGLINPKSNITRAEMAVILHRVLTY